MNQSPPNLDDLISLNQEIAGLVKSGVPLELGLRGLSGSSGTRFQKLSNRLADRLASGRSLPDALADEGPAVSPIYTAVIEAGLSSGRLPQALESLASSGQILQETRRRIFLASIYPTVCVIVAYALFCVFVTVVAQHLITVMDLVPQSWPVDLLRILHRNQRYFTMVIPSATLAVVIVTLLLRNGPTRGIWKWLTSLRWLIGRSLNWAQFTELLALQVDQKCPLPRAIVLAADSTDDRQLHREARVVSEKLNSGASFTEALQTATSLPPLVRWMLASGEKQGTLSLTLRQLSDTYRRRALSRASIVKVWLPVATTICFTGVIGLTYGLAFFIPLRAFLEGLMVE